MEKWVCKQCGRYQKVNPNAIKAGDRIYFYKNKKIVDHTSDQINVEIIKGIVLRRNEDIITILRYRGVSKVNAADVYPEDAPSSLIYNMFGTCEC